ncbi:hypothetical protein SCH4B_4425 [Ruegeria sp. TrichCH4B]|nr:hypothetical protein SCH4B_4425 [Ruegeria sp. TrichCH4B]
MLRLIRHGCLLRLCAFGGLTPEPTQKFPADIAAGKPVSN